jgi:hypothetical protein
MKFMMIVKGDADYEAGRPPSPELIAAIGDLGERARRAGKLLMQEGLKPSSAGMRLGLSKGKPYAVDGPFAETKEVIGGFALFELASREEALTMAREFVDAHARAGVKDMSMEVRPLYGPEDFGCGQQMAKAEHA